MSLNIINKNTTGLCNVCCREIPALTYEENNKIYIKKKCPAHGEFTGLVENDADFYKWFVKITPLDYSRFHSLLMPITYKCNMNCKNCYAWFPDRRDLPLEEIIKIVKSFEGEGIDISGGEPTIREDLPEIIKEMKSLGKRIRITTNGLKLSDRKYLRKLLNAGLHKVFLSFDSFDEAFYETIKKARSKKESILKLKKMALSNIEKENAKAIFSSTIYNGINNDEINKLFLYAFKNNHFISEFRIRNCVNLGNKHDVNPGNIFLSGLVDLFAKQTNIDKKLLTTKFLAGRMGMSVMLSIEGSIENDKFIPATETISKNPRTRKLKVKLVGAPTIENIDVKELKSSGAYLCHDREIKKIFHGIIRDEFV